MMELTLRVCGDADETALLRLAERDSSVVPAGSLLAAETCGRLVAALSLESGAVIADPFESTSDAIDLLRRRAAQIRRAHGSAGPPRLPSFSRRTTRAPAPAET
jgi:hypothetical protein